MSIPVPQPRHGFSSFYSMTVMLLWTWAKVSSFLPKFHFLCSIQLIQSLEDEFDGANRRNLRHFIQQDQKNNATLQLGTTDDNSIEGEDEVTMESDPTYYYVSNEKHSLDSSGDMDDKRKLMRIPTCAVFHKIARGKGVPHTFIGECYYLFPSTAALTRTGFQGSFGSGLHSLVLWCVPCNSACMEWIVRLTRLLLTDILISLRVARSESAR